MHMNYKNVKKVQGFTMIEVLVTLSIIAMIIALLFPLYTSVMRRAKEAEAQSMINQISAALTSYAHEFSVYIPDGDPSRHAVDTFYFDNTAYTHGEALSLGLTNEFVRPYGTVRKAGPYLDWDYDRSGSGIGVLDPWGKPYQYDELAGETENVGADPGRGCCEHDLDGDGSTEDRSVTGGSHNYYSFDVWSFGANQTNENGRRMADHPSGDDVNNWGVSQAKPGSGGGSGGGYV